ncbi:MAG: cell division protein ZapA [Bacteroidota bacterium]
MEELSIKIKICDREYPMKVHVADEARVRTAGKMVNSQVKAYKEKFGINDKQDLLAMVAFDCLVDSLRLKNSATEEEQQLLDKIDNLIQLAGQSFV